MVLGGLAAALGIGMALGLVRRVVAGAVVAWNVYRYTHTAELELVKAYHVLGHDDPTCDEPAISDVTDHVGLSGTFDDTEGYLELRYRRRGHKYRKIVRSGESWDLMDPGVPRFCPRIVRASLVPYDGIHETLDVTHRVQKYAGPRGDFDGVFSAQDMFPKERNTEYARVQCLDTRFRVREFVF